MVLTIAHHDVTLSPHGMKRIDLREIQSVTGVTVSYGARSNTSITVNFAISNSAAGGNHAVSVTANGQTSSSQNFYVQIPTYFGPTGFTSTSCLCLPNTSGKCINVHDQVLDQLCSTINSSGITPKENVCTSQGCQPGYNTFSTPPSTTASGTFDDIPIGTCFGPPVPQTNVCVAVTVSYQALLNGQIYPITTLSARKDCVRGEKDQIYSNPAPYNQTYTTGIVP